MGTLQVAVGTDQFFVRERVPRSRACSMFSMIIVWSLTTPPARQERLADFGGDGEGCAHARRLRRFHLHRGRNNRERLVGIASHLPLWQSARLSSGPPLGWLSVACCSGLGALWVTGYFQHRRRRPGGQGGNSRPSRLIALRSLPGEAGVGDGISRKPPWADAISRGRRPIWRNRRATPAAGWPGSQREFGGGPLPRARSTMDAQCRTR